MPCYAPLRAFYAAERNASGKRSLVFKREAAFSGVNVRIPCGQCIGCRVERSRQWAMRCMHEKRLSLVSEFLTLTYDDEHLPPGGSLDKRALQLFMKRLRKEFGDGIRFFACGEYGGRTLRPHYHLLLFNLALRDKRFYKLAKQGQNLYRSPAIERIWPYGFNVVGDVTFESCAYVARYICDKVTGDMKEDHYGGREPEFVVMSRRPGIGRGWFEKYGEETYKHDSVVVNGMEVRPPRYYDTLYDQLDAVHMAVLKRKRRQKAMLPHVRADSTPERRRVREHVVQSNLARNSKSEV